LLVSVVCAVVMLSCGPTRRLTEKADHHARLDTFHRALNDMILVGDYQRAMGLAQEMLFMDSTFIYLDDYHLLYLCGIRTGLVNTALVALHFGKWRASQVADPRTKEATMSAFEGWLSMLRRRLQEGEVAVADAHLGDLLNVESEVFPCLPVGGAAAIQRRVKLSRADRAGSGAVRVQATVDERGLVVDCTVLSSVGPVYDQAVVDAVYRTFFFPAFMRGKPVGTSTMIEVPVPPR